MTRKTVYHKEYFPAFGLDGIENQMPVCKYTVLSINESVRDCAAYVGIGPTMNNANEAEIDALIETIKSLGDKIREDKARAIFGEIEAMGLRYRP